MNLRYTLFLFSCLFFTQSIQAHPLKKIVRRFCNTEIYTPTTTEAHYLLVEAFQIKALKYVLISLQENKNGKSEQFKNIVTEFITYQTAKEQRDMLIMHYERYQQYLIPYPYYIKSLFKLSKETQLNFINLLQSAITNKQQGKI
jgi:hypothetical protein